MAEAETKSVADVPDARWFYSCSDDLWYGECATKEEAIAEGREDRSDGEPFQVAQGRFCGPFADLFDAEHLTDLIDESHEDRTWEEAFTEEAGLSRDDIVALAGDLNAVWKAFCDKHKPVSRRLNLWGYEDVPGTPEWQAREAEQDAACAAIARAEEAQ